jgi:VCBS repeat-containing protein
VVVSLIADVTPPGEAADLSAAYDPALKIINVNWKDPADQDFNRIHLGWGKTGLSSVTVTAPKGQQGYGINNIAGDLSEYTISLTTEDKAGNKRAVPQAITVIADGVPPAIVSNLTGTYEPAAQRIALSWDDPSDPDLKELRIQWGKIGQSQSAAVAEKGAETYLIPNIPGDMSQYTVSVRPADMLGNVSAAETVYIEADGIPPGPVSGLTAVYDKTAETITLSWADPPAADLKEIRLVWGLTGQSTTPVTVPKGAGTYTITGIPENSGEYTISLRSADYTGNQSAAAVRTDIATEPPLPPEGINAAHTENSGELKVSWNSVTDATAYEVWYHTVNNSADATQSPDVGGTTKTLTGLTNGTIYYIWVRSKNAAGAGNFSSPVMGTPKNNAAALDKITVNGQNISGFSAGVFAGYTAIVAYDSGNVTVAGIPAAGSGATASYSPAQPMTGLAEGESQEVTITVTAQNGTTQQNYSITVTKKKNFSMVIGPEEENITVEYTSDYGDPPVISYTAGEEVTFTVHGEYQAVNWFVDDSIKESGASFTVKARDYLPATGGKTYTLTAGVTKNGLVYSDDISFTVTQ